MWDLRIANPFGGVSARKILMLVTAALVAALSYIMVAAPTAHAADAQWRGNALVYDGKQYIRTDGSGNPSEIPANAPTYVFTEPSAGKAHFVYFEPNADPLTSPAARYIVYDYTPPNTFSNPSAPQSITVDPQSANSESTTSCDSSFTGGVGWIICPVTNFLAKAMDWLYGILSGFMSVRPVQTTQENALYRAWSIMRNFANVAFVIAFLIIIYSQVSSVGLSSYGIKKLLPRLIIAAVLVNISYWICAIAIDISNILGYSIQDLFIMIRNNLVGQEGNSWDLLNFESITGFILSGGTAAVAGGIGIYALIGGTVGSAIYMLLPILLGVLLAVIVALLILAARQAIITVLVILAPLAFVAYLLPNTEKYFEKWRDLGLTMLIMFPMFSIIFGGSQLAGAVIIQNADSINTVLLGMAVQIAPVVITPLLIRFSGSLLGRIAGMVNNPNRGLIDRTRKWAQERADINKNRVLSGNRQDFLARGARNIERRRRTREGWNKANQSLVDAQWENTEAAHAIHAASARAELIKQVGEAAAERHVEAAKLASGEMQNLDLQARAAKLELDLSKAKVEANWEEIKSGNAPSVPAGQSQPAYMAGFVSNSAIASRDLALTAMRKQAAERKEKQELTNALLQNTSTIDGKALREYAGGVMESVGAESVLASAVAAERKDFNDRVEEKKQLIKHFNLKGSDLHNLAMGRAIQASRDSNGNTYQFEIDDVYAREAAIDAQLSGQGNVAQIEEIIANSGSLLYNYRTTIKEAIPSYKLADKSPYLSGVTIDDVAQGRIRSDADLDAAATRALAKGKIKPAHLATADKDAVQRIYNIALNPNTSMLTPEDLQSLPLQLQKLSASAQEALTSPSLRGQVAQNVEPILRRLVERHPPTPPTP